MLPFDDAELVIVCRLKSERAAVSLGNRLAIGINHRQRGSRRNDLIRNVLNEGTVL